MNAKNKNNPTNEVENPSSQSLMVNVRLEPQMGHANNTSLFGLHLSKLHHRRVIPTVSHMQSVTWKNDACTFNLKVIYVQSFEALRVNRRLPSICFFDLMTYGDFQQIKQLLLHLGRYDGKVLLVGVQQVSEDTFVIIQDAFEGNIANEIIGFLCNMICAETNEDAKSLASMFDDFYYMRICANESGFDQMLEVAFDKFGTKTLEKHA